MRYRPIVRLLAPLAFLLVLLPAACTVTPETPRESLAAAEVTFQAALQTAQDVYNAGLMDEHAVVRVSAAINAVGSALDAWRVNPDVADSRSTAISALKALQAVLTQLGEKPT